MSLPLQAVDRLFARLQATYGRDFASKFEGVDTNAVKSSWAHELSGFAGQLECIAWALENLPERCPNVIEFRAICRRSPAPKLLEIEHSAAGKERIAAELLKLGPVRKVLTGRRGRGGTGNKDWARAIIANAKEGIHSRSSLPLKMAHQALAEKTMFTPVVDDREAA